MAAAPMSSQVTGHGLPSGAISTRLQVAGVVNLSVPIFGPLGTVIAALTSPYTERLDKHDAPGKAGVLKLLIAAGNEISQRSIAKD